MAPEQFQVLKFLRGHAPNPSSWHTSYAYVFPQCPHRSSSRCWTDWKLLPMGLCLYMRQLKHTANQHYQCSDKSQVGQYILCNGYHKLKTCSVE